MSCVTTSNESRWGLLVERLRNAEQVLLLAHVHPDADALGSALAVGLALTDLGVTARVSFPGLRPSDSERVSRSTSPVRQNGRPIPVGAVTSALPRSLDWLPGQELLVPAAELTGFFDVAVSLDVSSIDRLGELAPIAAKAGLFAAIDHHRSYTGFAELSIIDVDAPATASLALELIDRLGVQLSEPIASCLYAGLSADTGSFRFAATSAATHEAAARLHRAGIAHDSIARKLYDSQPLAGLRLLGEALRRSSLESDAAGGRGLVWTWVSLADLDLYGLEPADAESVIGILRQAEEADVAAVFKESPTGGWLVSLRSRGAVDVGQVSVGLGGGGHRYAAGFTAEVGELDEALTRLRAGLAGAVSSARADD